MESSGIKLESDFLIRIRHFVSDELRYPVLRVLLSPTMIFDKTSVIPRNYIDFGECIEIEEEFHLKLEVGFDTNTLSNAYMSISSILKTQGIDVTGETKTGNGLIKEEKVEQEISKDHLFSIEGEDEEKNIEEVKKSKIDELLGSEKTTKIIEKQDNQTESKSSEEEEEDEDEYLKKLEGRA